MDTKEMLSYIQSTSWLGSRPGLERITELLGLLGEPQKALKFVHVAGTNGKGSTSAMLASILRCAGYITGLYTSPHLQKYNERFNVNGVDASDEELCAIAERVKCCTDIMESKPTEFELITAMALLYFKEKNCDIVVLEVGLGGRLDATNVIPAPEVAVITNLGLEHTDILGDTIEQIAAEKGGIIKSGCAVVSYDSVPEALAVLDSICDEKVVPYTSVDFSNLELLSDSIEGQCFNWKGYKELFIPLLGAHQLHNAALVLETVEALVARGWKIKDENICSGLAATTWQGRLEVLSREPMFLLDGGHNPQCVRALTQSLDTYLQGQNVSFLVGVLADKDFEAMLEMVCPYARRFVCLTPDSPRAMPAVHLAEMLREKGFEAAACETVRSAIEACLALGDAPIVAFGSLYMAGAIRSAFKDIYQKRLRKEKIAARNALSTEHRAEYSERIVQKIIKSRAFQEAKTVLIYRPVRGEVSLEMLKDSPEAKCKRIAFPRCVSATEMVALIPREVDAWKKSPLGILEPIPEKSELIVPEEVDLVICPCTVFDGNCNRIGMGAGYYDRFLKRCTHSTIIAVAFECQMAKEIPSQPWDKQMNYVFSEECIYHSRH